MVAAAFTAVIQMAGETGAVVSYPVTASDVNDEYYVFPDGNGDVVLPSNIGNIFIQDVILSAAGTDTSQAEIYVNGKFTGEKIMNSANVGTVYNRQFAGAPVGILSGARLRIKQKT